VRCVASPAGIGQRIAELHLDELAVSVINRVQIEAKPVEADGIVERESGGGAVAGGDGITRRVFIVACSLKMNREGFWIRAREVFERQRKRRVVRPQRDGIQMRDDGLADAIVIRLDLLAAFDHSRLGEPHGAERG